MTIRQKRRFKRAITLTGIAAAATLIFMPAVTSATSPAPVVVCDSGSHGLCDPTPEADIPARLVLAR